MTIRLSADQADLVDAIAEIDGVPVVEVFRLALAEYVKHRRRDPAFHERARATADRHRRVMAQLRPPTE